MNYKVGAMVVEQGITPCILPGGNRKQGVPYRKRLGKKGHGIESLFAKIEDWRPIASRQDRCAPIFIFPSAVLLAATLFFRFSLLILIFLCSSLLPLRFQALRAGSHRAKKPSAMA